MTPSPRRRFHPRTVPGEQSRSRAPWLGHVITLLVALSANAVTLVATHESSQAAQATEHDQYLLEQKQDVYAQLLSTERQIEAETTPYNPPSRSPTTVSATKNQVDVLSDHLDELAVQVHRILLLGDTDTLAGANRVYGDLLAMAGTEITTFCKADARIYDAACNEYPDKGSMTVSQLHADMGRFSMAARQEIRGSW